MPDSSAIYQPRKPQNSQYYQFVEDNFETFEQVYEDRFERPYGFFQKAFDALEWLVPKESGCSHVPNKGEQMVRYYG